MEKAEAIVTFEGGGNLDEYFKATNKTANAKQH